VCIWKQRKYSEHWLLCIDRTDSQLTEQAEFIVKTQRYSHSCVPISILNEVGYIMYFTYSNIHIL
jgi:hypothetical protein